MLTARPKPREQELVGMLLAGPTNKEMARKLDLAEATIKRHMRTLAKKWGLKTALKSQSY